MILLEAHPVSGDVSGVTHGDAQPVGCIPKSVNQFEGGRFLALEPIGVHRIHQRDRVLIRHFPNDVQCPVEVAADGEHFSAVDQCLGQFSLSDIAVGNQYECTHSCTTRIGSCRC